MKTLLLACLAACTPHVVNPSPTPPTTNPMPADNAMVFAEELITRRAVAVPCVEYYGPIKVRVSTTGEITGVCP